MIAAVQSSASIEIIFGSMHAVAAQRLRGDHRHRITQENSASQVDSVEFCHDETTATSVEILRKIDKEHFRRALDEDVDLAVATEAASGVEAHDRGLAGLQNIVRARRDFFFKTSGAERANGAAILADQHSRTGAAITGAFCANKRRERKRFTASRLPFAQNVVDIFHVVGMDRRAVRPAMRRAQRSRPTIGISIISIYRS